MSQLKFIFTGPPGVGKTTAIAAISDIPPIVTEAATTDDLAEIKETTTVAMDYGELVLEDGEVLRLYGTPGQQRYKFMWDLLVQGGLGLILLIDNARPNPLDDLRDYLADFSDFIKATAVVIGVTRLDDSTVLTLDDYFGVLEANGQAHPLFDVDIRDKNDVLMLLDALMSCLEFDD